MTREVCKICKRVTVLNYTEALLGIVLLKTWFIVFFKFNSLVTMVLSEDRRDKTPLSYRLYSPTSPIVWHYGRPFPENSETFYNAYWNTRTRAYDVLHDNDVYPLHTRRTENMSKSLISAVVTLCTLHTHALSVWLHFTWRPEDTTTTRGQFKVDRREVASEGNII